MPNTISNIYILEYNYCGIRYGSFKVTMKIFWIDPLSYVISQLLFITLNIVLYISCSLFLNLEKEVV